MFNKSLTNSHDFSSRLLHWFDEQGRHDLPWQLPRTPYRVWLAEIMLQQTQVLTVIGYFERFVARFPTLADLAAASSDEVMRHWAGLGYYARARNLHKTAQLLCQNHNGNFPQDINQLLQLPGIGLSTAGAILAQAFGLRHAILDGNVKRVLTRYHGVQGWPGERSVHDRLWELAEHHTPNEQLVNYTQAIMDLGATLCTRTKPRCQDCPLQAGCYAYTHNCVPLFPAARPRKSLPVKTIQMLVMRDPAGRVLLERRPPAGIWGGLWSLPETEMEADLHQACQQRWGLRIDSIKPGNRFRHTFSHYHLDITPCHIQVKNPVLSVMEDDRWLWYNNALSERPGLPSPVTAILNQLNEE